MKYMKSGAPVRTYVAGSIVEFKVGVSTHHWGHYEFRICDRALDNTIESAEAGQNCLNSWLLERAPRSESCRDNFEGDCQQNNPQHPERWYLPPPGTATQVAGENWNDEWARPMDPNNEVHSMRFVIPKDLRCEHCTLQWYYATGNTCAYDADYFDFDPGFKFWLHYRESWAKCDNSCCGPEGPGLWAEEFWNCADVQVVAEAEHTVSSTLHAVLTTTIAPSPVTATTSTTTMGTTGIVTSSGPAVPPTTWSPPSASPVSRHGKLSTAGNRIIDEHGQVVQLRGMSLFWSQWSEGSKYYNGNVVQWLYQDWHVSLIRIAMGVQFGGFLENPTVERARVSAVVEAAIEVGVYVIIDWHDHHAEEHISEAKAFFEDVAAAYGKSPNVIFETFNEPMHQSWSSVIKPYHEEIIPVIRQHSDNLIVLGSRTWSQDVDEASLDPVDGVNLVYSLHFYANTHRDSLRQKAIQALSNGLPLFVTEWGTCSADGNGNLDLASSQAWLDFLEQNHISDANWAVSDKDEKCAALRPGTNPEGAWPLSHLTSSGSFVRSSIRNFHTNFWSATTTTTATQLRGTDTSTRLWSTSRGMVFSTTGTSTIAMTTTSKASTTSGPRGNCDDSCRDIKDAKECLRADVEWSMCSSSDSWWHSQCAASCAKCASGAPPCTTPPPAHCDPSCRDTKPVTECQNANTVWSMCNASDSWWRKQCAAFCGLCRGGLPPCGGNVALHSNNLEQGSSYKSQQDVATASAVHAQPVEQLEDDTFASRGGPNFQVSRSLISAVIASAIVHTVF
jgi:endoglucanase